MDFSRTGRRSEIRIINQRLRREDPPASENRMLTLTG
jgi:hypothetical protein